MSDALVIDSCPSRSQSPLFLKKFGCVSRRTDLSVKVPKWSNRSGGASPSATQHPLIHLETNDRQDRWFMFFQNGEGGIRTHGAREDTLVFKTRAINHSTTSPKVVRCPSEHLTTVSGRDPQLSSPVWPGAADTYRNHNQRDRLPSAHPGRNAAALRRSHC